MKSMKIKAALAVMGILLFGACKNATEDIKIVVDMNIIKYSALVHITDANGNVPQGITVAVSGTEADNIYEISGKKDYTVAGGIITLGLGPAVTLTDSSSVKTQLTISAPGYQQDKQTLDFVAGTKQQVINVTLAKVGQPVTSNPPTPPLSTGIETTFDFYGYCSTRSNLEIRPSLYLFFRESGSSQPYQYLGFMQDGHIVTDLLSTGKTYDFQINYGGKNYIVTQKIAGTYYSETFNLGSDVCNGF